MRAVHNFPSDLLVRYLETREDPVFTFNELCEHFKDDNKKAIENRLSLLKKRGWVQRDNPEAKGNRKAVYRWLGKTELKHKKRGPKFKQDLLQDTADTAAELLNVDRIDCNKHECACTHSEQQTTFNAIELGNAVIETIDALRAENRRLSDDLKEVRYTQSGRESQLQRDIRHYKQQLTDKEDSLKICKEKIKALEEALEAAHVKLRQATDAKFLAGRSVRLQNGQVMTLDNAFKKS